MSYAHCDWSVTVFISGYAKEIENGCHVFISPDANTRESLVEFEVIIELHVTT